MPNKITCRPYYHINIVYGGGCCVSQYREYHQTVKLFQSDYSKKCLVVSSSDWTDYNDTIQYQEPKYYCIISNGSFISIPKPDNLNTEHGEECVIVKLTTGHEL